MEQDDGSGGLGQELGAYDQLGPEGFRKMTGMGTLDERGNLIAQQLAQAQEFSRPQGRNYGSVAGNILGGLGDIVRQVGGGLQTQGLQGQQRGILDQKDAGRFDAGSARYEAMRRFMEKKQAQQQMQPPPPAQPMGANWNKQGPGLGIAGLTLDPSLFGG